MCVPALNSCYSIAANVFAAHNDHSSSIEEPVGHPLSQGAPSREPTRSVHVTEPSGTSSSDDESAYENPSPVGAPDDTLKCDCLRKASQDVRELQLKDVELIPYFQYLEEKVVPTDE